MCGGAAAARLVWYGGCLVAAAQLQQARQGWPAGYLVASSIYY